MGEPDVEVDPDEDRRGNLIRPATPGHGEGEGNAQGPIRRRQTRRRRGRKSRKGGPEAGAGDAASRPESGPEGAAAAPRAVGVPGPDAGPAEVVRAYLALVQESRVQAHRMHRQAADALGTPGLVANVDEWARRWTEKGRKETILGRARIEGKQAHVETTGEGFGPNRYRLVRDGETWRIDGVEGACPDCEQSGRCAVCEGAGCDVCDQGACPGCRGARWVPYRK